MANNKNLGHTLKYFLIAALPLGIFLSACTHQEEFDQKTFKNTSLAGVDLYSEIISKPYLEYPDALAKILGENGYVSVDKVLGSPDAPCSPSVNRIKYDRITYYVPQDKTSGLTYVYSREYQEMCTSGKFLKYTLELRDLDSKSCLKVSDIMSKIPSLKARPVWTTSELLYYIDESKNFSFGKISLDLTAAHETGYLGCLKYATFVLKKDI